MIYSLSSFEYLTGGYFRQKGVKKGVKIATWERSD